MAMVSTSSSLVVPIPTKLVLGFQRSSSIRSEFSAISFFKLRAKASPSSSTHLSSSFRFENVKSSKRMKQRMPILFAKPSEGGDILKGKSEEATEPQGQGQGQVELKVGMEKEVLKAGNGPKPVRGQSVTVHCTGFGKNGDLSQKFWSTKDPGQTPFTFKIGLGSVIKGWDEGVMGMQVGEIARLRCSPDYAYGSGGFPAWGIQPNSVLVFEIEVLSCGSNPIQTLFSKFKS